MARPAWRTAAIQVLLAAHIAFSVSTTAAGGELPRPKVLRSSAAAERLPTLKSVVIAPPLCDGAIDCSLGAREMALHARTVMRLRTIDAPQAEQFVFDNGLEIKEASDAAKLADRLGVDGVLFARLIAHEAIVQPTFGGGSASSLTRVSVEVDLITRDGILLVRGSFTEAWDGADRAFAGACKAIMRTAFPKT